MTHAVEIDFVARTRSPERDFIASILQQAVNDCISGDATYAVAAYNWIMQLDPWFVTYCELLDIDPKQFSAGLFRKAGSRCEHYKRQRCEAAMDARRSRCGSVK